LRSAPVVLAECVAAVIDTVAIERQDVFDSELPRSSFFLYRWGNAIHAKTRESVIRRELLYSEGEELDLNLVEETERNLRALPFIGEAETILAYTPDSARVRVTVRTLDRWSTTAGIIIPDQGGPNYSAGLELEEKNLAGLGVELGAHYRSGDSADEPFEAYGIRYDNPGFLGTRHEVSVEWDYDGFIRRESGLLRKPRLFLADPHGYRMTVSVQSGSKRWIDNNQVLFSHPMDSQAWGASYTRYVYTRLPKRRHRTVSLTLGLDWERTRYDADGVEEQFLERVPPDLSRTTLRTVGEYSVLRYATARYLESFGNTEDLTLGRWVDLELTRTIDVLGNREVRQTIKLIGTYRGRLDSNIHVSAQAAAGTGRGRDVPVAYEWNAGTLWAHRPRLVAAIVTKGTIARHAPSYYLTYLGGDEGLRGYDDTDLAGQNYAYFSVSERYFSPLRLFTVGIGAEAFLEAGKLWGGEIVGGTAWRGDIGGSLLLGLNRLANRDLVRIDIAKRLTESGYRWSIGYGVDFALWAPPASD